MVLENSYNMYYVYDEEESKKYEPEEVIYKPKWDIEGRGQKIKTPASAGAVGLLHKNHLFSCHNQMHRLLCLRRSLR